MRRQNAAIIRSMARPRKAKVRVRGDKGIGERLTRLRQTRGLSQAELAGKLGVDQSDISNFERGVYRLNDRLIVQICKLLRIRADELLGLAAVKHEGEAAPGRRILRRLQKIDTLPKRDQLALLRVIDNALAGVSDRRIRQNS